MVDSYDVAKELAAPITDDTRQWLLLSTSADLLAGDVKLGLI